MPKYSLSERERQLALQLAECVLSDNSCLSHVCQQFNEQPFSASAVMDFWKQYSVKTKSALNKLMAYKCRTHLELCLQLECKGYPDMEK